MKDGLRSRDRSGQLEKDDVPLSSLVPMKNGSKLGGGGRSSGKKNAFELKKKKKGKKRSRLISSDTDSDTELLASARKKVGRKIIEDSSHSAGVEKSYIGSRKRKRNSQAEKETDKDAEVGGENIEEDDNEVNESKLDVFAYTEDDLAEYKTTKKEVDKEGSGSVEADIDNRKRSRTDKKFSLLAERSKGLHLSDKEKCNVKEDKTICPVVAKKEKSKVSRKNRTMSGGSTDSLILIDKKKKADGSKQTLKDSEVEENKSLKSPGNSIGKRTRSSVNPIKKVENPGSPKHKLSKTSVAKKNKKRHLGRVKKDTSLQQGSENVCTTNSVKKERKKEETTSSAKICLPTEARTEKQLIRDQIIRMVESAGWKIDYRPRKNREYNDAVYIDHAGYTYWSVVKAYNALKRQCENMASDEKYFGTKFSFTPLPQEVLDKLLRRTQRSIEREKMMKRKTGKGNRNSEGTTEKKKKRKSEKGDRKAEGMNEKKSAGKKHVKKSKGSTAKGEKLNHMIRKDGKSLKKRLKENTVIRNKKARVKIRTSTHNSDIVGNGMHNGTPKSKNQRGYALLVRKPDKEMNSDGNHFVAYPGKLTVLSWLIDSEIVLLGGKVKYMNKRGTRTMLEGWITKDGINCCCCNEIVTISEFETHAGSKLRQPCKNIFLETGVPLFQCQIDAWNKQEESEHSGFHRIDISSDDPNDDTCGICGDGGDLICCDGCPSTFHQSCLGIQALPGGDWHCSNCCCKFCGCTNGQGDDAAISILLTCSLCEEKYHGSCVLQRNIVPINSGSLCISFCGQKCSELFEQLQKLLGVKHELDEGFSWTIIQRSNLDSDTSLCGLPQKVECNSRLALALSVMDECFLPTIDERSGINLIHNVIYNCGSNFNRLNYSGFYTFILEKGDEIISVASIRIHGTRFAEMPFIGTRHKNRRQGMCRRLLDGIELALSSLQVEKLIIPAILELMDTWTKVFGFNPLEESDKDEVKSLNMIVFPGVALLQKRMIKHSPAEVTLADGSVLKAIKPKRDDHSTAEAAENSNTSSILPDSLESDVTVVHHATEVVDEAVTAKTGFQPPGDLVQDTTDASNPSYVPGELASHSPEDATLFSNSQSQHESIYETKSFVPEAEENLSMNSSVGPNLQTAPEETIDEAQKVNKNIDDVESEVQSSSENCSRHTKDVIGECLDLHSPEAATECYEVQSRDESSIGTPEMMSILPKVDHEPPKNTCLESSTHGFLGGIVNYDQEVNMIGDVVESNLHSSADRSAQHSTCGLNKRSPMHSPKEKTEYCKSQSRHESFLLTTETESLRPVVSKTAFDVFAEHNLRACIEGVVDDAEEVIVKNDRVEREKQSLEEASLQHPKDMDDAIPSTLSDSVFVGSNPKFCSNSTHQNIVGAIEGMVSLSESCAIHCNKISNNASADVRRHDEVETAGGHCVNGTTVYHFSGTVAKFQVSTLALVPQHPSKNVICHDSEDSKQPGNTTSNCNLKESLKSQNFQLLQNHESSPNASYRVDSLSRFKTDIAVVESNSKYLGADVQEVNMINDGVIADLPSLADNSAPDRTDVSNECLVNHCPNEETECHDLQSRDVSTIVANETESFQPLAESIPTVDSSAEPNIQAFIEGAVGDSQERIMKTDDVKPEFQSLTETSAQCTTDVVDENLNAVSGSVCVISNSTLNSDSSHQNTGVESESLAESDAIHCAKITNDESDEARKYDEVKTLEAACEKEASSHQPICTVTSTDIATSVPNFEGPVKNVFSHDSERKQLLNGAMKCNLEESLESPDSQLQQQTQSDSNASGGAEKPYKAKKEATVAECDLNSLRDPSLASTSEMVNGSVCAAPKSNCIASIECNGQNIISNSCNSSSEVPVVHASEAANINTHDVLDGSLKPFPRGCKLEDSADRNTLATRCERVISLDHNSHVLPRASPCDSLDTATETISSGSRCTSELLHKVSGSMCDTAEKVASMDSKCHISRSVELSPQASGEGDSPDIRNSKNEVDLVETNATTCDEDSVQETSEY